MLNREEVLKHLGLAHPEGFLVNDLKGDLHASPKGLQLIRGREGDLLGRLFLMYETGGTIDRGAMIVSIAPQHRNEIEAIIASMATDKEEGFRFHPQDVALSSWSGRTPHGIRLYVNEWQGSRSLRLAEHETIIEGHRLRWSAVPAWHIDFCRTPSRRTEPVVQVFKVGNQRIRSIIQGDPQNETYNLRINALGDLDPVATIPTPEPGEEWMWKRRPVSEGDFLKNLLSAPYILRGEPHMPKEAWNHRTSLLLDALQEAYKHAEAELDEDLFLSQLEIVEKNLFELKQKAVLPPFLQK